MAEPLLVDDVTVRRWHKEYQEGVEDRLLLMRNGGSVSDFNREHRIFAPSFYAPKILHIMSNRSMA